MARIEDEVIKRIKDDISLVRLAERQGYALERQGKDYAVSCPFHDDKTPSCMISPQSNLFNCFGCGESGSVIDWVMKTQKLAFREAVVWLSNECLPFAEEVTTKPTPSPLAAESLAAKTDAEDQALLQQVIDFYHKTLKSDPDGLAYLDKRGLNDVELINTFKLGYANRSLGLTLPLKQVKAGADIRAHLQSVGLYRESGHEHFNGSLVVPIIDTHNQITEVYGRKTIDRLRKGTPKHLYLPGPHVGVFNPACLVSKEIILCESLIDALTFWRHGFKQVTCSYGTNGFTPELLAAFKQSKTQRVIIAYDRDAPGDKAALTLAKTLQAEGIECFRALFPKGMDANAYALNMSPPEKALALVIRKAEWMGEAQSNKKEQARPEPTNIDQSATVKPATPQAGMDVEHRDSGVYITVDARCYRVRGHDHNKGYDQLKIQLLVQQDEAMHLDKLDLYSSKHRQVFINQASLELGVNADVIKQDLSNVLLVLEGMQTSKSEASTKPALITLDPAEKETALALLRDPSLLSRLLDDFERAGVIGEEANKLVGYLACVSRKLDKPLAVMIQSSSAAGKSSLMESILAMIPEEERVQYSAMTGQSLFYMGETNLKHKILAIAEEEGASNASYALKLLQSEGEVTIASTCKDDAGNLMTKEYKVEGPVMLFFTTTAIDNDEELVNRCLILSVDESREQTQAIHAMQRRKRTLAGLEDRLKKADVIKHYQNAQRLLKPLKVINPYADALSFVSDKTRTRRDNEKYLTLIDSIALLHQYQREIKTLKHDGQTVEYIEVSLEDIAIANRLVAEAMGHTLDELPPQTRKLLKLISYWVSCECTHQHMAQSAFRFTRRAIREYTGWGNTQIKIHCKRLEDLEYLIVHRGRRGVTMEYELLYRQDECEDAHYAGLIDLEQLGYDVKKSGFKLVKSVPSRPQVGEVSGPTKPLKVIAGGAYNETRRDEPENTQPH